MKLFAQNMKAFVTMMKVCKSPLQFKAPMWISSLMLPLYLSLVSVFSYDFYYNVPFEKV